MAVPTKLTFPVGQPPLPNGITGQRQRYLPTVGGSVVVTAGDRAQQVTRFLLPVASGMPRSNSVLLNITVTNGCRNAANDADIACRLWATNLIQSVQVLQSGRELDLIPYFPQLANMIIRWAPKSWLEATGNVLVGCNLNDADTSDTLAAGATRQYSVPFFSFLFYWMKQALPMAITNAPLEILITWANPTLALRTAIADPARMRYTVSRVELALNTILMPQPWLASLRQGLNAGFVTVFGNTYEVYETDIPAGAGEVVLDIPTRRNARAFMHVMALNADLVAPNAASVQKMPRNGVESWQYDLEGERFPAEPFVWRKNGSNYYTSDAFYHTRMAMGVANGTVLNPSTINWADYTDTGGDADDAHFLFGMDTTFIASEKKHWLNNSLALGGTTRILRLNIRFDAANPPAAAKLYTFVWVDCMYQLDPAGRIIRLVSYGNAG